MGRPDPVVQQDIVEKNLINKRNSKQVLETITIIIIIIIIIILYSICKIYIDLVLRSVVAVIIAVPALIYHLRRGCRNFSPWVMRGMLKLFRHSMIPLLPILIMKITI